MAVDGFDSCLAPTQVVETKNFDADFALCREDGHGDKPEYVELMSGIPEETVTTVGTVQEDLEISDSDEENKKIQEHEMEIMSENAIGSNNVEDEDQDDLWF